MTYSHQETATCMPVMVPGHELSSTNFNYPFRENYELFKMWFCSHN